MKQIYQLCVSPKKNFFSFVLIENKNEYIEIFSSENLKENYVKFMISEVQFLQFLNERILFIQTLNNIVIYNIKEKRKIELINIIDKISEVIFFDFNKIIYINNIDLDKLYVYKYCFKNKIKEKIIEINLLDKKVEYFKISKFKKNIVNNIFEKIKKIDKNIVDTFENNEIIIKRNFDNTIIKLGNNFKKYEGYIDRIFFLSKDKVIFSISSFKFQTQIIILDIKLDLELKIIENKESKLEFEHLFIDKIPMYKLRKNKKTNFILFFLHGGPEYHVIPFYYPWVETLLNIGIEIYFINYSGSTGYGEKYRKELLGKNGEPALKDLEKLLYYFRDKKVIILGESFGGYLSVLSSFFKHKNLILSVSLNGFVDYKYLYLFSFSKVIISKYFDLKLNLNNPINLLENHKINRPLFLFNSIKDIYSPIKSIENFVKKANNKNIKLYKIRKYKHYELNVFFNKNLYKKIISEIKKEVFNGKKSK